MSNSSQDSPPPAALTRPFHEIHTYGEHARRAHVAKSGKAGYHQPKSRKKQRMAKRAPVRDSKRAYHMQCIRAPLLSEYRALAKGQFYTGAATVRHPKTRDELAQDMQWLNEELNLPSPAAPATADDDEEEKTSEPQNESASAAHHGGAHRGDGDDVGTNLPVPAREAIDLVLTDEDEEDEERAVVIEDAEWPHGVTRIKHTENPFGYVIPDLGSVDWCSCGSKCLQDRCANARAGMFCAKNNCRVGRECGNRLRDADGLQLKTGPLAYTVFSSAFIPASTIIGEYAGVLTAHDCKNNANQTSAYAVELQTKSSRQQQLYLDAKERGSLMRFINHSCEPNCSFFEVHNRRHLTVVVSAIEDIPPGTELSVDYGDSLWFKCRCGSINCRETD